MCDQQRLRPACACAQSGQSLCWSLEYSLTITLPTEQNLEFLSLKGDYTWVSESKHIQMPHFWKSHVEAHKCSYRLVYVKERKLLLSVLCYHFQIVSTFYIAGNNYNHSKINVKIVYEMGLKRCIKNI